MERPKETTVQEQTAQVINTLADIQLSVSNFMTQIHFVKQYISQKEWSEITSHSEILEAVNGAKILFSSTPHQPFCPRQCFSGAELDVIDQEIASMLSRGIIQTTSHSPASSFQLFLPDPRKMGATGLSLT